MSRHRDPDEVEAEHKFTSFRRVIKQEKSKCQLMSFHSVSKGVVGECGRRGGYLELMNIDPEVEEQILKLFSIGLCSNISGQIMVGCMVNPPKPGDASYVQFVKVGIPSVSSSSSLPSLFPFSLSLSLSLSSSIISLSLSLPLFLSLEVFYSRPLECVVIFHAESCILYSFGGAPPWSSL